jgi:hypothetical protein
LSPDEIQASRRVLHAGDARPARPLAADGAVAAAPGILRGATRIHPHVRPRLAALGRAAHRRDARARR